MARKNISSKPGASRSMPLTEAMASRINDRGRPAYGHFVVRQPRRTVLWATTNDDKYLKSQTGNRRFLPVKCGKEIDKDKLRSERDQLWGEAAYREAQGESTVLPRELWAAAQAEQNARLEEDPYEDELRDLYGDVENGMERVTTASVLHHLGIPKERWSDAYTKKIRPIMKRLGWEHKDSVRIGGQVKHGYQRKARPEAEQAQTEMLRLGQMVQQLKSTRRQPVAPHVAPGLPNSASNSNAVSPVSPPAPKR